MPLKSSKFIVKRGPLANSERDELARLRLRDPANLKLQRLKDRSSSRPDFGGLLRSPIATAIQGKVIRGPTAVAPDEFLVELPSGHQQLVRMGSETYAHVMSTIGDPSMFSRVVISPEHFDPKGMSKEAIAAAKYGQEGMLVLVRGTYHPEGKVLRAAEVVAGGQRPGELVSHEETFNLNQLRAFAEQHFNLIFRGKRTITVNDWMQDYQTFLNQAGDKVHLPDGAPTKDLGALARVIYDFSTAYHFTGNVEYLKAAHSGLDFQRRLLRVRAGDSDAPAKLEGQQIIYRANELGIGSTVGDDTFNGVGSLPAYLQIYALAGAAKSYQSTHDARILEDIHGMLLTFKGHFHDSKAGGWNSHLDVNLEAAARNPELVAQHPEVVRAIDQLRDELTSASPRRIEQIYGEIAELEDSISMLGDNRNRKTWNSLGDHGPAYLIDLLVSLGDPVPEESQLLFETRELAETIAKEASELIATRMPVEDSPGVHERFRTLENGRWTVVDDFRWQAGPKGTTGQDRIVVGHNFKIAWNQARFAFHFQSQAKVARSGGNEALAKDYDRRAALARRCALDVMERISKAGLDPNTGAVLDVIPRFPEKGMTWDSPWESTRDFWHQEQALLAGLILAGLDPQNPTHLQTADRVAMVWNSAFLDTQNGGTIRFRVDQALNFVSKNGYGDLGRNDLHYHETELASLSAAYLSLYVTGDPLSLHYSLSKNRTHDRVTVKPDFVPPDRFEIESVTINGEPYVPSDAERLSLTVDLPARLKDQEVTMTASIRPRGGAIPVQASLPHPLDLRRGL